MSYWKNNHNKEIDAILETSSGPIALEIKSSATFSQSFFENLHFWSELHPDNKQGLIVYGGDKTFPTKDGKVIAWNNLQAIGK
jgi:predicted AAA+ superfamily ATPase